MVGRRERPTRSGNHGWAAASLGRLAGGRLGQLGRLAPVVGMFAKGPRLKTWMRVAAVATLVVPLLVPLVSRARSRNGTSGPVAGAE